MLRRTFLATVLMAIAVSSFGQDRTPQAGKDYLVLPNAQNTETGDKVEVVEFFWYRCPHCFSLEPYLETWVKKLPSDTQFRRIPAVFSPEWALDAKIYYALEAMGELDRLHGPLFEAIHKQGGLTQKGDAYVKWVRNWLGQHKLDAAKFDAAMNSFAVDSKVKRAAQVAQAWRLDGVPALGVNGRYLVSASMIRGDQRTMLAVTDYVLAQARQQRTARK